MEKSLRATSKKNLVYISHAIHLAVHFIRSSRPGAPKQSVLDARSQTLDALRLEFLPPDLFGFIEKILEPFGAESASERGWLASNGAVALHKADMQHNGTARRSRSARDGAK